MKLRKEFDSIGSINVPNDKYWGASTQRSNKFFNIGKILVNISIIKSIAIIKRSSAIVHSKDKLIDKKISTCLYTGIMTDTGSFRFPLTSETTHKVISTLIKLGANGSKIHDLVYNNNSAEKILLLSHTLRNIVIEKKYNTAYMFLSQDDLNKFNFKKGDTEGFVNYGLSLEGIVFSCIMIENESEGIIKMSFRSQGEFSVNDFARAYFNGGGHHNAAGGMSADSMKETVARFEKATQEVADNF